MMPVRCFPHDRGLTSAMLGVNPVRCLVSTGAMLPTYVESLVVKARGYRVFALRRRCLTAGGSLTTPATKSAPAVQENTGLRLKENVPPLSPSLAAPRRFVRNDLRVIRPHGQVRGTVYPWSVRSALLFAGLQMPGHNLVIPR